MNRMGDFCLPNGDKIFVCTDDNNEEILLFNKNDGLVTLEKVIESFKKGEIFYKFLMDNNLILVIDCYRMMIDLVCRHDVVCYIMDACIKMADDLKRKIDEDKIYFEGSLNKIDQR